MNVIENENYRVIITPDLYFDKSPRRAKELCERLEQDIKRHIDGYESVEVKWDAIERCEYCKSLWEVDENGSPLCCGAAVAEWDRLNPRVVEGEKHD